jgi:hypothetical protein
MATEHEELRIRSFSTIAPWRHCASFVMRSRRSAAARTIGQIPVILKPRRQFRHVSAAFAGGIEARALIHRVPMTGLQRAPRRPSFAANSLKHGKGRNRYSRPC